jgi:hypothetical protein
MKAALIALSALVVVLVAVRWVSVVYWHSLAASSATRSTPSSYESPKRGRKPSQRADFRHTASAAPAELLGTHTLMTRPTGLVGAGYSGWRPSFDPFDDDRGSTLTAKRCEDCWTSTGGQA